jgi:AraC family transcriptional regulator
MGWQERMNRAIAYLESRLQGQVRWEAAARRASCSVFHFLRMFEVIAGVSAAEYVRRRRLAVAAVELSNGRGDLDELASRFGYDGPEAFDAAFRREFGVSPQDPRVAEGRIKPMARLAFERPPGERPFPVGRIEHCEALALSGVRRRVASVASGQSGEIRDFWIKTAAEGTLDALQRAIEPAARFGLVGVVADLDPEWQEFSYVIAIETPADRTRLPGGCVHLRIEPGTWAAFESRGPLPSAIVDALRRVYGEWLPASGYEHAGGPDLEVYRPGDRTSREYACEVWIPIVRASSTMPSAKPSPGPVRSGRASPRRR